MKYEKPDLEEIKLMLEGPCLLKTSDGVGKKDDTENDNEDLWD